MSRFQRVRASRTTLEVVSWTIGILLMVGLTILVATLTHALDWSWP